MVSSHGKAAAARGPRRLLAILPPGALAEGHLDDADGDVRNMANALLPHCERLFAFLEVEGVEPANNVAETGLRTAVQWRKISFGNRSRNGEIAIARLLTVSQTCKRQQRRVLAASLTRYAATAAGPPRHVCARHGEGLATPFAKTGTTKRPGVSSSSAAVRARAGPSARPAPRLWHWDECHPSSLGPEQALHPPAETESASGRTFSPVPDKSVRRV